jgi:sugar transferase (PEP-CTERM/EpsH1 system associated)
VSRIDADVSAAPRALADVGGAPPLVAHVLFHFDIGGLENGVINLIDNMPRSAFRHAIVCVRGRSPEFHRRLTRDDVPIITLDQKPGLDPSSYARAWRVFRALKPDIVHTRNLAALEMQLPAFLAGVPARVHSEHGREGADLKGDYRPYNLLRKVFRLFVHRYVGMSRDLQRWLVETVGVAERRVDQIYNGVDTRKFRPRTEGDKVPAPQGFLDGATFIVGAVGRVQPVKDHQTLVRGFARLVELSGAQADGLRLILVGGGPGRAACEQLADALGVRAQCWFAGDRGDVDAILRGFDVFCLTSLNEGINNTVLEAMATGLPIVATNVGGNPELVTEGETGTLVPSASPEALANALRAYLDDPALRMRHGAAARADAERRFGLDAMVRSYVALYKKAAGRQRDVYARGT